MSSGRHFLLLLLFTAAAVAFVVISLRRRPGEQDVALRVEEQDGRRVGPQDRPDALEQLGLTQEQQDKVKAIFEGGRGPLVDGAPYADDEFIPD